MEICIDVTNKSNASLILQEKTGFEPTEREVDAFIFGYRFCKKVNEVIGGMSDAKI